MIFLLGLLAALPPDPVSGPLRPLRVVDDQNARSMAFASISPSSSLDDADLFGPVASDEHGELLRAWSKYLSHIWWPYECCHETVCGGGMRDVAKFQNGEMR